MCRWEDIHRSDGENPLFSVKNIQTPVVLSEAEEVAQRHPKQVTKENPIDPRMSNHKNCTVTVPDHVFEKRDDSLPQVSETFSFRWTVAGWVGSTLFIFIGKFFSHFLHGESIPQAHGDFTQAGECRGYECPSFRDDAQGFPGTEQVAAVCREKRDGGELFPPPERLLTTVIIEERVLLSDVAFHVILSGITVTQQIDDTFSGIALSVVHMPQAVVYYQFQIKDDLKAVRIEAARRTEEDVEQPKTSQRREGLDMEL
jgi:hypothetical protein